MDRRIPRAEGPRRKHHVGTRPNTAETEEFRVGQEDSNDICRRVQSSVDPFSRISSREQSGTVKFTVSGSGKKGGCSVFPRQSDRTLILDAAEVRK